MERPDVAAWLVRMLAFAFLAFLWFLCVVFVASEPAPPTQKQALEPVSIYGKDRQ